MSDGLTDKQINVKNQLNPYLDKIINLTITVDRSGGIKISRNNKEIYFNNFDGAWSNFLKYFNYDTEDHQDLERCPKIKVFYE